MDLALDKSSTPLIATIFFNLNIGTLLLLLAVCEIWIMLMTLQFTADVKATMFEIALNLDMNVRSYDFQKSVMQEHGEMMFWIASYLMQRE